MKKSLICLALLAGSIGMVNAQKAYKAYVVSNAHFDTQWNWDVQTSINEFLPKTMTQNLYLLERYPNYIFNFEGGVKYAWMKEYYPENFAKIKEYIKQGRWHVTGSTWDANDPNIPSPESFFKNILLGQTYYKKELGVTSKDIFLPDCFGFGYTLPTIAAHAGLIGFSTQKLSWRTKPFYGNSKIPFPIGLWQGVDGSRIMAALDGGGYGDNWNDEDISNNNDLRSRAKKGVNNTAYRYYGTGDTGGSPTVNSLISLEKGLKGTGDVQIISASSDQLYKDYLPFDKHPELPVFNGELLMDLHATGCYTSQAAMKRFNRRNEQLGDAAERISVFSHFYGGTYPKDVLTESWRRFIWHQFHDDLTGTSIQKAYTFSWNDELIAQSRFADVIRTGVGSLAGNMNTQVKGIPVVLYNSMGAQREDLVTIKIAINGDPEGIAVFNEKGKEVAAQILSYKKGEVEIALAADLAPLSCTVYDVRLEKKSSPKSSLSVTSKGLENSIYKLTLDTNGDICSLIDKRINKEMVQQGKAFRLGIITENESDWWPAWEIMPKALNTPSNSIVGDVNISIAQQGNLMAVLKVERKHGASTFVQYIRMTEGVNEERIDILNDIDWATSNALLKAEFPMNVVNKEATYDLGLGTIKRGNNIETANEVYAQQWADITATDDSYGISILNNCKYGWDKPEDNLLRLTLLHTPKTVNHYQYQDKQDLGRHYFTYSIVGHNRSLVEAGTNWDAENLNNPVFAFVAPKHKGALGKNISFAKTSTSQMAIKSLKKAEDSDLVVIRLYETQGKSVENAEVIFPVDIESAIEMNGVEEEIGKAIFTGNKLSFSTSAYKPKTFGVKLKKAPSILKTVKSIPIELTYTHRAFTPDAFRDAGNYDQHGNSYSADLIGNEIVSDGIPFTIKGWEQNNIIKCKGHKIDLPQSKKKLYILAASSDRDRKATFKVDGKEYPFSVPYYSGFYGQWGNTGFSKSYMRDATLAYIGSHRHNRTKNEAYVFTYIYKFEIEMDENAKTLELPNDENITVFAVTVSDNYQDDVKPVNEMRTLPL